MSELNPQPLPPRAIRVEVAGDILNDLERFQSVQASILNKVGCPTCTSGVQILWQEYENWVVDGAGGVLPVAQGGVVQIAREG
jgi:hypothetical protein